MAGGRRAAPPRRLDDAAMIFITVEPNEVRAEVLLSLREFLDPLRIAGGPGSVVPVEVQERIAERAKEMVADTMTVTVDGRDAVPLLQRTGMGIRYVEARDGHNWENWRDRLREGLSWLFPGPLWMVYE